MKNSVWVACQENQLCLCPNSQDRQGNVFLGSPEVAESCTSYPGVVNIWLSVLTIWLQRSRVARPRTRARCRRWSSQTRVRRSGAVLVVAGLLATADASGSHVFTGRSQAALGD